MAKYVITDGSRWIQYKNGKYVPTSCPTFADEFSQKQAKSIYENQLPKALKKQFRLEKISDNIPGTKPCTTKDIDQAEKVMMSENIKKWLDKVSNLNGLAKEAQERRNILLKKLSQVDKELCDIYHYIEFCNLNAAQGYKSYKMIKDRRIKRRSIKNELDILNIILGKKISDSVTDEIQKAVLGMDKRKYEPRVMNELFDF